MQKTIAVLGITGRTGRILCSQLLENGCKVKALVRSLAKAPQSHPNLEIFEGSLENTEDIQFLINNTNAVISVLGYTKNSPPFFQTHFLQKLIPLMENSSCKRLIVLTGSGVMHKNDRNTFGNKFISFILQKIATVRFEDGVMQLKELEKSDLNWTLIRTPLLTNSPEIPENINIGNIAPGFFNKISRAGVSSLIIKEIQAEKYLRRPVFIYQ